MHVNAGHQLPAVELTVTDKGGLTGNGADTPVVELVNDAPEITVTAKEFVENSAAAGQVAATWVASDEEDAAADLVVGFTPGSNNEGYYAIVGGQVVLTEKGAAYVNAGHQLPAVELTVTDKGGLTGNGADTPVVELVNDAPEITVTAKEFVENSAAAGQVAATWVASDEEDAAANLVVGFTPGSNAQGYYEIKDGQVVLTEKGAAYVNAGHQLPAVELTVTDKGGLTGTDADTPAVELVNDAPEVTDYNHDIKEDGKAAGQVKGSDTDGDSLTYAQGRAPAHGTVTVDADGKYTYTPHKDFSGSDSFTVIVSDGKGGTATSTVNIGVTPVADTPLVSVTVQSTPEIVHGSINRDNAGDTGRGYTITANGANGKTAALSNVPTAGAGGKVSGFGVAGSASGDDKELGYKETLTVKFDQGVTNVQVKMSWLASGETAHYVLYDVNGKKIGEGDIKGKTDVIDDAVTLTGNLYNHAIGSIVFSAQGSNDDYLIHEITYDVAQTAHKLDIVVLPQDVDYSESVSKVVVEVSAGASLNVGKHLGGGLYELPLDHPVGYQVVVDPVTGQVTITGVQVIPGKGATGDVTVKVHASVEDGTNSEATGTDSATFDASAQPDVHEQHATLGNDSLLGSSGDDVFIWQWADRGTIKNPGNDTVQNFGKQGNDKLDLSDLLQGEEKTEDLSQFLHFDKQGGNTVVKISSSGDLKMIGGDSVKNYDQLITLEGVDLVGSAHGDQNKLIHNLIQQGKLLIDGHN
ncbi:Ig-like domain-containing protein [Comamonas sp. CAH-2]|uniref:Ig-like domain-containing protein n=1 Tax=Comamonas sp. CAH-2 TaxID=2605745 RepID=UPI0013968911